MDGQVVAAMPADLDVGNPWHQPFASLWMKAPATAGVALPASGLLTGIFSRWRKGFALSRASHYGRPGWADSREYLLGENV